MRFFLMMMVTVLAASMAQATTWKVRADGSGHYYSVQAAVDIASSGDVIDIGPGIFLTEEVSDRAGAVAQWEGERDLVITGAGAELTILTAAEQKYVEFGFGIGGGTVKICDVTLRGLVFPVNSTDTDLTLARVVVENCDQGVHTNRGKIKVLNSRFLDDTEPCHFNPMQVFFRPEALRIGRSEFRSTSVQVTLAENADIGECRFEGWMLTEIKESTVDFHDNEMIIADWRSALIVDDCVMKLRDNRIVGGWSNLTMSGTNCDVEATGNLFYSGQTCNIFLYDGARLTAHGNDIHQRWGPEPYFVNAQNYDGTEVVDIEMGGNFWAREFTPELLHNYIHDQRDDGSLKARINVEPIMSQTVPSPPASIGSVKALFR